MGQPTPLDGRASGNMQRKPGCDVIDGASHVGRGFPYHPAEPVTDGWSPSCACAEHSPVPSTVLDPFGGAGTTGLVADRLGRNAILIELNPQSVDIAKRRISGDAGLFGIIKDSAA
ncbi:MAG: hypothetical protein HQL44_17015 [Alphaproteobacteria bacterium]|nr:hypothetical protein [Alphaproteobacteria bacterium]